MRFQRQETIVSPEELTTPILIVGVGGIGSWLTLTLAKMGCKYLRVMDNDKVELKNTGSQLYTKEDIGKRKVVALEDIVRRMTGTRIAFMPRHWKPGDAIEKIMIIAVDDIEERKKIWLAVKYNPNLAYFIDTRMGGELMRIYLVDLKNLESHDCYEKTLVAKKDIEPEPCTARAIAYNVFVIAGLVANLVKKIAKREPLPFEIIFDLVNLEFIVNDQPPTYLARNTSL